MLQHPDYSLWWTIWESNPPYSTITTHIKMFLNCIITEHSNLICVDAEYFRCRRTPSDSMVFGWRISFHRMRTFWYSVWCWRLNTNLRASPVINSGANSFLLFDNTYIPSRVTRYSLAVIKRKSTSLRLSCIQLSLHDATRTVLALPEGYHIKVDYQSPGFEPASLVVFHVVYGRASSQL